MALLLFDLNGTLLDPGENLPLFERAILLAMAHTLAGDYRPFSELLRAAGGEPPVEMPPYPDVDPGLHKLREAGHRLVILTNSEQAGAQERVERAGLSDSFERIVSVDAIGVFKPHPRTYAYALEALGADARDSWLVASHDWDLLGARSAGLRTAFVQRSGPAPATFAPDRHVERLDELSV